MQQELIDKIFNRAGLENRANSLGAAVEFVGRMNLNAILLTPNNTPDENMREYQDDLRKVLVSTLDVFAKVLATRLILNGVASDQAMNQAWVLIEQTFVNYSQHKRGETDGK